MAEEIELSELEFDALREVGNVGVGNAVTALSKIINKKIEIDLPQTKFVPITKFTEEFGGPEKEVMAIYLKVSGDLSGESFFFFEKKDAFRLVDLMMGKDIDSTKEFDEFSQSAFTEMSNIFSGAYLSALSNMLSCKIFPGVPNLASDMLGSIVDGVLSERSLYSNQILFIKTDIVVEGQKVGGQFVLMFDIDSLNKIKNMLKEKFGVA
jgi:chemotaxis protein CheC